MTHGPGTPAASLLHGLSGGVPGVTAATRLPIAGRRGWLPWTLAAWRWHHVITPRGQRAEREGERSE